MRRYLLFITFAALICFTSTSVVVSENDKARARELVSQMTLEEKISYLSGETPFSLRPIERLGIPRILLADGPQGIRNHCDHSTLYPSGIAAAATWNREVLRRYGASLGEDARARGVGILLGPGVNIYRYPLCGRNFEYMGEDPYLASEMACNYIEGVQSNGVIATIKHFAGNNQEYNRHHASSDIDERTLHEIYFPTFRKAVEKAGVGAVMNSYNLLNGVHSTENPWLNITILRDTWCFDGILMSDWTSVYSTAGSANAGLDLEMPGAEFFTDSLLRANLANGRISIKTIDEKVTHILQTLSAFGLLDREQKDSSIPLDNPSSSATALATAREGIVLLKNEGNILPLHGKTAVLGINADTIVSGGGSGAVFPYSISPLSKALPTMKNDAFSIPYAQLFEDVSEYFYTDSKLQEKGFAGKYYGNMELQGTPAFEQVVSRIDFNYGVGSPGGDIPVDGFSVAWSSVFITPKTERLRIAVGGDDGYRLSINDSVVAEHWGQHAYDRRIISYPVVKGKTYDFKLEYFDAAGGAKVDLKAHSLNRELLSSRLKDVENVVICTGFDSELESEGFDRPFALPDYEATFINEIASINPKVTVVINAGGAVDLMPWMDSAKGILMAWYPGQDGGTAIAEILAGKISPSGKLPFTWYAHLEDSPAYGNYYPNSIHSAINPSEFVECDHIDYREGIFHGYRCSDVNSVRPLYPFGYGLTYSSFEFSDLNANLLGNNGVEVSFNIRNTGKKAASNVAQIYVCDKECSVPRPIKELKGFEKVHLNAGESAKVSIILDEDAFSFYDLDSHKFVVEPGEFEIMVGDTSENLPLTTIISL